MATYLVTGAAGFIASKVCEFLLADGHKVIGVDNLNDYYDVRLKDWRLSRLLEQRDRVLGDDAKTSLYANTPSQRNGLFEFHFLDIENLNALDRVFQNHQFDAVFNLAARAGVRYSLENPHVYLSTNALGTLNLLECQRKHDVKKHILASTSSLYAGCPMPFTEDQSVNTPLSPYAATKKAAEALAYSYHNLFGLDVSVLRYFTVFGPAGQPDMAPFRFIKWIAEGTPITLFGDGTQSRDFTYVDDIARGTILARKSVGYEVINLGGGNNPVSLRTIIEWIWTALAKTDGNWEQNEIANSGHALSQSQSHYAQPITVTGASHPADANSTWADITKAQTLLHWNPAVTPLEGFNLTVEWYLKNRNWLCRIKT